MTPVTEHYLLDRLEKLREEWKTADLPRREILLRMGKGLNNALSILRSKQPRQQTML